MFGLSFGELFVIGLIALIVIGPERLPKVARTVGFLAGRAQRYISEVKSDIEREMQVEDLKKFKDQVGGAVSDMKISFEKEVSELNPLDKVKKEAQNIEKQLKGGLDPLPDFDDVKDTVTHTAQTLKEDVASVSHTTQSLKEDGGSVSQTAQPLKEDVSSASQPEEAGKQA